MVQQWHIARCSAEFHSKLTKLVKLRRKVSLKYFPFGRREEQKTEKINFYKNQQENLFDPNVKYFRRLYVIHPYYVCIPRREKGISIKIGL